LPGEEEALAKCNDEHHWQKYHRYQAKIKFFFLRACDITAGARVEVSSSYPKLATRLKSGRNDPLPKTQFSRKKKVK
jgi:hypothetical protein